jgi:Flp pilus assembly pilin Flp
VQLVNSLIISFVFRFRSERGQDLLEYALLGGLIAGAIISVGMFAIMSGALTDLANGIANCIDFQPGGCTGGI